MHPCAVVTCYSCVHELVRRYDALESVLQDCNSFYRNLDSGDIWDCDCGYGYGFGAFRCLDLQNQSSNGTHEQSDQSHHTRNTWTQTHHAGHDLHDHRWHYEITQLSIHSCHLGHGLHPLRPSYHQNQ